MKQLNTTTEKCLQELRAHQPSLQQFLNDLPWGLQPVEVLLSHIVPPSGLTDRAAAHEHGERRISVIPQKESYFLPPVGRTGHQEVEVGINSTLRPDKDVHTTLGHHFRT
jgi:hypothetical protein